MNGAPASFLSRTRPTAVRWQVVLLLMAFSYLSWFHRKSMTVAADERVMGQYGISPEEMGYVYSGLLLTYALCMTPGGWLIDRFGTRAALLFMGLGLAAFGALTGLIGLSPALIDALPPGLTVAGITLATPLLLFLLIRSLMGIFATPMYPASAQAVAQWMPFRQRGMANGLVQGSALVGVASTPWVFGYLIDHLDWPVAFLLLGGATLLLAVVWAARVADRPKGHPGVNAAELSLIEEDVSPVKNAGGAGAGWRTLLGNRSLVCLTLSYAAVGYFEYLFFFWMEYYFKEQLRLDNEARRTYAGVVYLAMAAGMGLGGLISDSLVRRFGYRLGRALVPVGGLLAGAAFLAAGVAAKDPGWIVALLALALAAVGSVEAPVWTTAQELGGKRGGTAAAICNTGGNAGGLIAPVLTPWVGRHYGWPTAIALGSAACLLGVLLWIWIDPRERVGESE